VTIEWRPSRLALVDVPLIGDPGGPLVTEDGETIAAAVVGLVSPIEEQVVEKLLQQFRDFERIEALLRALVSDAQPLEDALFELATERGLAAAEGVQLDGLGELLGLGRAQLTDAEYRAVLRAQILALRSGGTAAELLQIVRLALDEEQPARWREYYPAAGTMTLVDPPPIDAEIIVDLLHRARLAGVRLFLLFPPDAPTAAKPFTPNALGSTEFDDHAFSSTLNAALGGLPLSAR
jgi:hypothetical protein